MTAADNPMQADAFNRLLNPAEWAKAAIDAKKKGWPVSTAITEIAHRIGGRYTEADRIAADLAYNRLKNSGDLMRRESQRALELQIQKEDNL